MRRHRHGITPRTAGFVGPLATRWLGRRYQLGPANWNISAIRLALFAGTIVSAAAGLTGLLVFASSNTHWMLELARWLVSDTIAAQTLGVLHLRYRWKLVRELRTPNNAIGEV